MEEHIYFIIGKVVNPSQTILWAVEEVFTYQRKTFSRKPNPALVLHFLFCVHHTHKSVKQLTLLY